MSENNKTEEFLQELAPCIERADLDACVEEAVRLAGEMEVGAQELLDVSSQKGMGGDHAIAYVLALAAAQGLEGEAKALAYSNAGLSAQYLRKVEKAEEHYKQAIAENPNDAAAHSNYANLLSELDRKPEAEEHYKLAIAANPNLAEAYYNNAILLIEKNLEPFYYFLFKKPFNYIKHPFSYKNSFLIEAEKNVRKSLELEHKDFDAHIVLGDILLNKKYSENDLEMAEIEYIDALNNSSSIESEKISSTHNKLGYIYYEWNQYEKARKEFKQAIDLNPMNLKARRNLHNIAKFEKEVEISMYEISKVQKILAIIVFLFLIALFYMRFKVILGESEFITLFLIGIGLLILIPFHKQLKTIKFGSGGIEIEKSETMAKSSLIEAKTKSTNIEP